MKIFENLKHHKAGFGSRKSQRRHQFFYRNSQKEQYALCFISSLLVCLAGLLVHSFRHQLSFRSFIIVVYYLYFFFILNCAFLAKVFF